MKTALLALACITCITAIVIVAYRRQATGKHLSPVNEPLRSHLAENRDYLFFVGVPLDSPVEWKQAQREGLDLSLSGEPVDLDAVRAFLVAYPNGQVLSAQREFFPLPEGVGYIETARTRKRDILDLSLLAEGKAFVTITYGPSSSHTNEPGHYSTAIQNISDKKLRVTKFGAFMESSGFFWLNTISGDYFSADEFINWYGVPQDGWLQPGATVKDPNNYGSGKGYWVYYFETEDGKELASGAQIPQ